MSKIFCFLKQIDTSQVAGQDRREAWMPKGDRPYFDPSACRTFQSRREKRAWLRQHGMRETGMLVTLTRGKGRDKTRLTPERRQAQTLLHQQLQRHGGVQGLREHLQHTRRWDV